MAYQTIGKCSICGGNVKKHVGGWYSIDPPPPPQCDSCGAIKALPIIPMVKIEK